MKKEIKEVEVIIPDNGKCLKISDKLGNLITYMKDPYYKLPEYNHIVEEVDVTIGLNWFKNIKKKMFKFFK